MTEQLIRMLAVRFNFLSWFKFVKKNKIPNIIEIIEAPIKEESISE